MRNVRSPPPLLLLKGLTDSSKTASVLLSLLQIRGSLALCWARLRHRTVSHLRTSTLIDIDVFLHFLAIYFNFMCWKCLRWHVRVKVSLSAFCCCSTSHRSACQSEGAASVATLAWTRGRRSVTRALFFFICLAEDD